MISDNAQTALNTVVARFAAGDIAPLINIALIRPAPGDKTPSLFWSLANRLIAYLQTGELDCRGFRQWKTAGRHVVKGATAAYILGPCTYKELDKDSGEEKIVVKGFHSIPVFPAVMTEGETIPHFDYRPAELPPLQEAARRLGLRTEYLPALPGQPHRGAFYPNANVIALYTTNPKTWFHELAHAAHNRIEPLTPGQTEDKETVAEFTAIVLMTLYGYEDQTGNSWKYITSYSEDPLTAIYRALSTVEKVLALLLSE